MELFMILIGVVVGIIVAEVMIKLIGPGKATLVFGSALVLWLVFGPTQAEAAGRSYTPSRSYTPRPAPRIAPRPTVTRNVTVNKTTVNRTTVIQQRGSSGSSGPSAAGSFISGAAGAFGGSLLGSWLMAPKEQEAPQQVAPEAPVAPVVPPCDTTLYYCTPKGQVTQ